MTGDHLVDQLSRVAGLRPSQKWIEACQSHLRQHGVGITVDNILFQALDLDLRNVIRFDSNTGSILNAESSSVLLRRKCKESMGCLGNLGPKSTLPADFRLCLQIEELLDVSKNAEARLSHGPASMTSPTPIGDQSRRCIKMIMSDGYFENGSSSNPPLSGQVDPLSMHSFTAMETSPIPNLSVHSQPGIKVVISGPIDIRYGILMLHPGNTFVLGGCIPALIPIQKKAMELAAKEAGVGIDATFRALVWNPEAGMDETDEGDQESSDVPPVSVPIHAQNQNVEPETIVGRVNSSRNISDLTESTLTSEPFRGHIQTNQDPQPSTTNPMVYEHSNSIDYNSTSIGNPYTNRSQPHGKEHANPYNTSTTQPLNPYSIKSTSNARPDKGSRQESLNPYQNKTRLTSSDLEHSNIGEPNSIPSSNSAVEDTMDRNGFTDSASIHVIPSNTSPPPESPTAKNISMTNVYDSLSPSALTEPMTFPDFHGLLQKIISDLTLYKKYEGVTFVVPCKLFVGKDSNKNMAITIEKNKNYKKDKKSKGEKAGKVCFHHYFNIIF